MRANIASFLRRLADACDRDCKVQSVAAGSGVADPWLDGTPASGFVQPAGSPSQLYETSLRCTLSRGMRDDEVSARVVDDDGRAHYVTVPRSWIEYDPFDGTPYLAVKIFEVDPGRRRVLVAFPAESDGGSHRAWMGLEAFKVVG